MVVLAEGQHFGAIRVALFEISKQPLSVKSSGREFHNVHYIFAPER